MYYKKIYGDTITPQTLQVYELAGGLDYNARYRSTFNLIYLLMQKEKLFIFDTIGVLNEKEITLLKQNHIVKVVGRGDI